MVASWILLSSQKPKDHDAEDSRPIRQAPLCFLLAQPLQVSVHLTCKMTKEVTDGFLRIVVYQFNVKVKADTTK